MSQYPRTFTPDEIAALIAKLEMATGPDREIDTEIWLLVTPGATRKKWSYTHTATGRLCEVDETRQADRRLIIVPDFTASVDAAAKLTPQAHDWALHVDNGKAIAGCMPASEDGCDCSDSHGATPALALCIAALKARAALASAP